MTLLGLPIPKPLPDEEVDLVAVEQIPNPTPGQPPLNVQRVGLDPVVVESLTKIDEDLGAPDSVPAPADGAGAFSISAAFKRLLQQVFALLARVPAMENGRVPVSLDPQEIVTGPVRSIGVITNSNLLTVDGSAIDVRRFRSFSVYLPPSVGGVVAARQGPTSAGPWYDMGYVMTHDQATAFSPVTWGPRSLAVGGGIMSGALNMPFFRLEGLFNSTDRATQFSAVFSAQPFANPYTASWTSLNAGSSRIGQVAAGGIWWEDATVGLAAGATFTGGMRDLTGQVSGFSFNAQTGVSQQIVTSGEQDVPFVLYIEVSRDGGATWRTAKAVASMATLNGHYAEIVHQPSWRFQRPGILNGATASTRTVVSTFAKA
jgi:hypothetical protein